MHVSMGRAVGPQWLKPKMHDVSGGQPREAKEKILVQAEVVGSGRALRMIGATRVPSRSMARVSLSWWRAATLI